MDRKQKAPRKILFWICALALGVPLFGGCLSYSYSGMANLEKQPDKSLIGKTVQEVIAMYGNPDRVMPLAPTKADGQPSENDGPKSEFGPRKAGLDSALVEYNGQVRYTVLLYFRQRGNKYTLTTKDGRVVAMTSTLTQKADGLSLSVMPPLSGTGGGANAGGRDLGPAAIGY